MIFDGYCTDMVKDVTNLSTLHFLVSKGTKFFDDELLKTDSEKNISASAVENKNGTKSLRGHFPAGGGGPVPKKFRRSRRFGPNKVRTFNR